MPRLKTSQYSIQRFDSLTSRSLNLRSSRLCRAFPSRSILDFARNDKSVNRRYFTESAGTILMLSITMRLAGLLGSPRLFLVTSVSPILSSTSWPFMSLPNVVY